MLLARVVCVLLFLRVALRPRSVCGTHSIRMARVLCNLGRKLSGSLGSTGQTILEKSADKTLCSCDRTLMQVLGNRLSCMGSKFPQAGGEACQLWTRVRSGDIRMRDLANGGVYTLQILGLFFAGEIIGRGSFFGYAV